MRRWLLIPLAVLVLLGLALLALPAYLASTTHRPTVEALASSLTGRQVRIAGPLAVALFPTPEVTAGDVTITGPAGERITTSGLTLDLSGPALLHGRLAAQTLTLTDPVIAMPWPLPGGAAGISPPGWLTTLHAVIVNGSLSLGTLMVTGVRADIYTDNGAVTLSGDGALAGGPATLNLALQRQGTDGTAPLSVTAKAGPLSLHLAGALSAASTLTGALDFTAGALTGQGPVSAEGQTMSSAALTLRDGPAALAGTASLTFAPPHLQAELSGAGVDLSALPAPAALPIPASIGLSLTDARIAGRQVPTARLMLDIATDGTLTIAPISLSLPGQSTLDASITRAPDGALTGTLRLTAQDLVALSAAYGLPPVPDWASAHLTARLGGSTAAPALTDVRGTLGPDHVTGAMVFTTGRVDGGLAFSHLDLLALRPWLTPRPGGMAADGEITAATASLGPLALTNVLIDGAAGPSVNIRRLSAALSHGLLAGSLAAKDGMMQGSLLLDLPSGAALAPVVASLTGIVPPAALLGPRLTVNAEALGTPAALSTSAVATLGDFTATAAPIIDLTNGAGAGALTLRHPNAIRALSLFDLNRGLDWPGAGSLSLRATAIYTAKAQGVSDFILSLGQLSANGRLLQQDGQLTGTIDAGNLALPPWPKGTTIPWAALGTLTGSLRLTADQLSLKRQTLISPLDAQLNAAPGLLTLTLKPSGLAGGTIQGHATVTLAPQTPPALTAAAQFTNADATQLPPAPPGPFSLAAGTLSGSLAFNAVGYSPITWEDTLGGTLTLNATNGTLNGLSLTNLATALTTTKPNTKQQQTAQKTALTTGTTTFTTGTTTFTTATLTATLTDGNATLTTATQTPNGPLTTTGTADLPDNNIALTLTTPETTTTLNGPWRHPTLGLGLSK